MEGGEHQTGPLETPELLQQITIHRVAENRVMICLKPEKEAFHLVGLDWRVEETQLKIQPWWQFEASQNRHLVIVKSKLSMEENQLRVRDILGAPENSDLPNITQMSVMDMLFWNCRGAGNNKFRRTLKDLITMHKPDLLVLMETKVDLSSMGMFFNSLGYSASSHVDPIGRSGGIWMLWNINNVNVRVSKANSQMILATISKQNYPDWMLAAVYASPNPRIRDELWDSLETIAQTNQLPWLLVGDFNDHASPEEKRSYSTTQNLSHNISRSRKFVNHINKCNLIDLGCTAVMMIMVALAFICISVSADPDLLQDVCVADSSSGVKLNGVISNVYNLRFLFT
ncbi:hypothetical protein LOK49_LG03G03414 [Camellia lanceoleosa]|uniref:Uncharacterized protein n=1 Tax=Camellia lanceoleosa TaxID=1840588 RepID=A0ACC0I876_9ERIC|nr:hypothetical protein LOK49_LG03G03414 [Camellia lanceoleosa]